MTDAQQLPQDHDTYPTQRSRRSILWRTKVRLQFTGWLQYLITAVVAAAFLAVAGLGWLIGVWQPLLLWTPLGIGLILLVISILDVITVKWGLRPAESLPRRSDHPNAFDMMRARRSCHSFQKRDLTEHDRSELMRVAAACTDRDRLIGTSPIRFEYIRATRLAWTVEGAHEFLVAIAPRNYDRLALLDVGRSLQKVVLHATRTGVSTCWIGPGANQTRVVEHLGDRFDPSLDHVVCICALGYRSRFLPLFIRLIERVQNRRLPLASLFFADPNLRVPLAADTAPFAAFGRCYEVCQWSPSSYNAQTTRCVAVAESRNGTARVARLDFFATTTSRFYAPVAVGIWCANWETGCAELGIPGHFAVLPADAPGIRGYPDVPHYDVSWIADPKS